MPLHEKKYPLNKLETKELKQWISKSKEIIKSLIFSNIEEEIITFDELCELIIFILTFFTNEDHLHLHLQNVKSLDFDHTFRGVCLETSSKECTFSLYPPGYQDGYLYKLALETLDSIHSYLKKINQDIKIELDSLSGIIYYYC